MSLTVLAQKDATNQKFYLAVVDETGTEHKDLGKLELKLADIRALIAAAGAITLLDPTQPAGEIKFREIPFCMADGSIAYGIVPVGGFYTKPV